MNVSSIKILFIFLIVLSCIDSALSQDSEVIDIGNLGPDGIVLEDGWKFKIGDDAAWANVEYDDTNWKGVNPVQDIFELPMLWKDSIVWFRIRLRVDSLQVGDLAMSVSHAGASEFYLNGRLIHRFGVVSTNAKEIFAFDQNDVPVSFPVTQPGVQVLVVRYILEPNIRYTTEWANENFGLNVSINSFENANQKYEDLHGFSDRQGFARISAYLILSLLYLAFYISYRRDRTNLYFFVYVFIWAVVWSLGRYLEAHSPGMRYNYYVSNISLVLQLTAWYFCLSAMYELLRHPRGWIFYGLCLFGLVLIPVGMFVYPNGWLIYPMPFMPLAILDIFRVSVVETLRRKKGAVILATGALLWFILWLLFIVVQYRSINVLAGIHPLYMFSLSQITMPLAVAIYIGYDFAFTNRSLAQKLLEVETLSCEKNRILSEQNEVLEQKVAKRTSELTKSLEDLKVTQSQLIHSEKMASLGELTAGIAHEIQNPLNFVNNFSEVNKELIEELSQHAQDGNLKEVQKLARDIIENEEKIEHHGKRADAIVKSMLLHSRASSGKTELTDVNALCDEYSRLAYHGYRAKDKSFNATLETNFDPVVPSIQAVPQEIGRVVLNLVNNAFYAVNEKGKIYGDGYKPIVKVSTKKLVDKIEIKVSDNGIGIPNVISEKIFQPFFTTKPTGQGTGLGLSLSYDIVQAHRGTISLKSTQDSGSEFIVQLPT